MTPVYDYRIFDDYREAEQFVEEYLAHFGEKDHYERKVVGQAHTDRVLKADSLEIDINVIK